VTSVTIINNVANELYWHSCTRLLDTVFYQVVFAEEAAQASPGYPKRSNNQPESRGKAQDFAAPPGARGEAGRS
jgi:hypothetical protein